MSWTLKDVREAVGQGWGIIFTPEKGWSIVKVRGRAVSDHLMSNERTSKNVARRAIEGDELARKAIAHIAKMRLNG